MHKAGTACASAPNLYNELEVMDGMKLDRGHISPYSVTTVKLRKPGALELNHKMTRQALRVDARSTPGWVKGRLKLITKGRLQSRASYGTRDWSKETAQRNGNRHTHSAGTTREAIADLKKSLQQGITTDPDRICQE